MRKDDRYRRQDFLWYSYFGITETKARKNKEEALERCIWRAYRDLSRTLGFKFSGDDLKKESPAFKKDYERLKDDFKYQRKDDSGKNFEGAGPYIASCITALLTTSEMNDTKFQYWHKETCKGLVSKAMSWHRGDVYLFKRQENADQNGGFTYGHAQKWLNMTLKNMLIMNLWDMSGFVSLMHVPIDNYILGKASSRLGMDSFDSEPRIEKYGTGYLVVFPHDCKRKWSQFNNDEYEQLREVIERRIKEKDPEKSLIEWETDAWLGDS